MKIAVVYNFESQEVINLFGTPNQEKYGLAAIKRITDSLKQGGHVVTALEGDKDLIDKLEEFMPRVLKGERPGMVFNISYGIQGQARYTHVPGILEMIGIPYVGSGPLAHSLALDKVVAKMIFRQYGVPTPDFAVLDSPGFASPDLEYPLIVKPKNEARSFGLKIVNNEEELREAADVIFREFDQAVLAERYIEGKELNVGILGNSPPSALPPAMIVFGGGGPNIYTLEDKTRASGREITLQCPAPIGEELIAKAQEIAKAAFKALGCYDCCRVDFRLDDQGNLYVLEVNSLPSLGQHGSYVHAAEVAGLDFAALVNRLVDVASARYFGTPKPPQISSKASPDDLIFGFLTERRDRLERRVRDWTKFSSRTNDPVGIRAVVKELSDTVVDLGLRPVESTTDGRAVWTWETESGYDGGSLVIVQLDVPREAGTPGQAFRRDPEHLFGDGIGVSRAPLASLEYSLRALRSVRRLRRIPLGVLAYADEGQDCHYSADQIRRAADRAGAVLVLRPGRAGSKVVDRRRGRRTYRLVAEGVPRRLGQDLRKPDTVRWAFQQFEALCALSSKKERVGVGLTNVHTESYPMLLPHRIQATLLLSYPSAPVANDVEQRIRELLRQAGHNCELELISDRPPMERNAASEALLAELGTLSERWEIPLAAESSVQPSAAGLVPGERAVICGFGPVAQGVSTPDEAVERISLMQRTLLLTQFLVARAAK